MRTPSMFLPTLLLVVACSSVISASNPSLLSNYQDLIQHSFYNIQDSCDTPLYQPSLLSSQEKDLITFMPLAQNVTQLDMMNLDVDLGITPANKLMTFDHEGGLQAGSMISCILIVASVVSVLKTIYTHFIKREDTYAEEEKSTYDTNLFASQPGREDVSMSQSSKFPVNIFILDNVKQVYTNIPKNAILIYA